MITIRTGANGSYKSAYTAYYTILPALQAGRTVVTNFEGMETIEQIEKNFNIKLPESAKLIRIFSRNEKGIFLWQHFFCWCPLNAVIVIDECQDIYSKNINFDSRKITRIPFEECFKLLPDWYESFFNSRYTPADLSSIKDNEVDDIGALEYDELGRIIYPANFNEGFMRHRKYNWDIELLSPDWSQIDSSIKACAEQAFYHKSRDSMPFCKRKPYIYKHSPNTKPSIPKTRDANLITKKIPLKAHLLYKSTGTGKTTGAKSLNVLFTNPKFYLASFLAVGSIIYGLSLFPDSFLSSDVQTEELAQTADSASSTITSSSSSAQSDALGSSTSQVSSIDVHHQNNEPMDHFFGDVNQVIPFNQQLSTVYLSAIYYNYDVVLKTRVNQTRSISTKSILLKAFNLSGDAFYIRDGYLSKFNVAFEVIDECTVLLSRSNIQTVITCEPFENAPEEPENTEISLLSAT